MTPDKQRQKLAGHSAIARKVFESVPIAETWTHHQISQELHRTSGSVLEVRTVLGCLNTLVDAGLVRRHQGAFRREPVSAAAPLKSPKETQPMATKNQTPAAPDSHRALDVIGALAQELRGFADRLDAVALQVVESQQGDAELAGKYRMVQQLLGQK